MFNLSSLYSKQKGHENMCTSRHASELAYMTCNELSYYMISKRSKDNGKWRWFDLEPLIVYAQQRCQQSPRRSTTAVSCESVVWIRYYHLNRGVGTKYTTINMSPSLLWCVWRMWLRTVFNCFYIHVATFVGRFRLSMEILDHSYGRLCLWPVNIFIHALSALDSFIWRGVPTRWAIYCRSQPERGNTNSHLKCKDYGFLLFFCLYYTKTHSVLLFLIQQLCCFKLTPVSGSLCWNSCFIRWAF